MTKNKDQKRIIRARMSKTGESYTSARAAVVAKKKSKPALSAVAPEAEWPKLAGQTDEVMLARTGRSWAAWVALLDAAGAPTMSHRDIARHIRDHHPDIDGWWAQGITVGYERIRGLRDVGQRRGGKYDANKTRTFPVAVGSLYRMFAPKARAGWLGEGVVGERKAVANKTRRFDWEDGTRVTFVFMEKGPGKSSVAIQHSGLESREAVVATKAFWDAKLAALAEALGAEGRKVPKVSKARAKTTSKTSRRSPEVDAYLAALPEDQRRALESLRQIIHRVVPGASEAIRYQLPAFTLDGKSLVAFGAARKHCAFYPMSGTLVARFAEELAAYPTSKGTIRFTPDAPLPKALVTKLVKARVAENRG
ncbi:MAG: DUF1801 domain-containing protein [Polyangiaceae bacterium]